MFPPTPTHTRAGESVFCPVPSREGASFRNDIRAHGFFFFFFRENPQAIQSRNIAFKRDGETLKFGERTRLSA